MGPVRAIPASKLAFVGAMAAPGHPGPTSAGGGIRGAGRFSVPAP